MNVDFLLAATPAIARKLMVACSISRVDIDDKVREIANQGLLTFDDIKKHLPTKMTDKLDASMLKAAQHAADYEYRFPVVTSGSAPDAIFMTMLMALSSGKKVVAIETTKNEFTAFAKKYLDDFVVIKAKGEQQFDYDAQVLIVPESKIDGEFISKTRDRVVVGYSVASNYWDSNFVWDSIDLEADIHNEYPFYILTTHGLRGVWSSDVHTYQVIKDFYPNLNINTLISRNQTQTVQASLANMGFNGKTPEDIAALLGIYLNV